ncbi:MAG: hypothetical protein HYS21_13090 [Deltaproteobacteria bacterium]|nr:hypothetical protein [Deltaproteobacteria bacterium]
MTWLWLIIALAVPTVCGFVTASYLLAVQRAGIFFRLFLGFGLGMGFMAMGSFFLNLAGVQFSFIVMCLAQVIIASPFLVLLLRRRGMNDDSPQLSSQNKESGILKTVFAAVLIFAIAIKVCFVLYSGLARPIYSHDAWSNWSAGAKLFYYNNGLLLDNASEFFFGRGYRMYMGHPLITPLAQTYLSAAIGDFNEALVKAWAPFYFISTLGIFYFALRKETMWLTALVFTFFLSAAPLFSYHALDAYADLPLAFYVLAGSVLMWEFMERGGKPGVLALSGLLFAMGAFTKNEGIPYMAFAGSSLLVFCIVNKKGLKTALFWILPALLYIAPWIIFKSGLNIGFGHAGEAGKMNWINGLHLEIFPLYIKELFLTLNFGFIFPFFAVMTLFGLRKVLTSNIKYLYAVIALMMATFLFIYITTFDFKAVTERTGINRNIMTFIPLSLFIASLIYIKSGRDDDKSA